jgi:hypothetical protein
MPFSAQHISLELKEELVKDAAIIVLEPLSGLELVEHALHDLK